MLHIKPIREVKGKKKKDLNLQSNALFHNVILDKHSLT